jgi:hypothetical protein
MVEDIYVGEFYEGSEYIRYARDAPRPAYCARPVACALATGYRYRTAPWLLATAAAS